MDDELFTRPWRSKDDARVGLGLVEKIVTSECSNGLPLAQYLAQLRSVERSPCTTVWRAGSFAYRCRDCQVTDSSAICVECFKAGPHVKHDYIMYRSAAGGCCDCGDPVSLKEEGFCSLHAHREQAAEVLPERTLAVFQKLVSLLLARLVGMVSLLELGITTVSEGTELVLKWLQQICSVPALREVVCREMAGGSAEGSLEPQPGPLAPLSVLLKNFVIVPSVAEEETTLFLLMLYNHQFKKSFSRVLLRNYADWVLNNVHNEDAFKLLDSCLDRVMVQLINVESITLDLIKQERLLDCFLHVLRDLLKKAMDPDTNMINCNHDVIANRLYTRPLSDLRLIVSHHEVGLYILVQRSDLLHGYLALLETLQNMHPIHHLAFRDLDEDIGWMHAVAMETYMTSLMTQLLTGCDPSQESPGFAGASRRLLFPALHSAATVMHAMLARFYISDYLSSAPNSRLGFSGVCMSLHLPLHRAFGMVLAKLLHFATSAGVADQFEARACLQTLASQVESQRKLAEPPGVAGKHWAASQAGQLMEYPLRILFWMAEIRGRQWRNQGEDLARLERVYQSAYWNEQTMDMDVLVVQFSIATGGEDSDELLLQILERYKVADLLTKDGRPCSDPSSSDPQIRSATLARMLEVLRLILQLVRERRYIAMSEIELVRYEVIQWLCCKDMTYSTLSNFLPQALSSHARLEEVLRSVATYVVPKLQERGFYRLKPECWREFDVLFAHYTKGDLEEALSRAVDIGKLGSYWRLPPLEAAQPPFDTLCNILHSQVFHRFLYVALDQSLQLLESETNSTVGKSLGVVVSQLITTAALDDRQGPGNRRYRSCTPHEPSTFWPFLNFALNDIAVNIRRGAGGTSDGWSMLDLFRRIRQATNSNRLLDSVQYVFETTKALTVDIGKTEAPLATAEASTSSPDAESQRQLKKQRQAAILADFAARQKAFLSESRTASEAGPSGTEATFGAAQQDNAVRVGETVHQEPGPSGRVHERVHRECAFCLGDQEMNPSPMGWIAFIQMSNIPAKASQQLQRVETLEQAEEQATCERDGEGAERILCSVLAQEGTVDGTRGEDLYATGEHVGCCGHQMHMECFQRYVKALGDSRDSGRVYEGYGIINLARVEYLCPICRRLSNFLLPDVETEPPVVRTVESDAPSEQLPASNFPGLLAGLSQSADPALHQFWNAKFRQYENWCQLFVGQCRILRMDSQPDVPAPDLASPPFVWRELWSILAANVVHCEVETRGSSGAAPRGTSSDQVEGELLELWGGASAHWRALRALAKLAVLSTTFDEEPLMQREMGILDWQAALGAGPVCGGGLNPKGRNGDDATGPMGVPDNGQSDSLGERVAAASGVSSTANAAPEFGAQFRGRLGSEPSAKEASGPLDRKGKDAALSDGEAAVRAGANGPQKVDKQPLEERDVTGDPSPAAMDATSGAPDEGTEEEDASDESPLEQDPFWILVFLFQTHVGFPSHTGALAMVNVAYHAAAAQAFLAAAALRRSDADEPAPVDLALMAVVQAALVPFLRRAAILVHVVSGRLPPVSGPGALDGDLMSYQYWERYLGLPPVPSVLQAMGIAPPSKQVMPPTAPVVPRHLLLSGRAQLKLVDLPDVFQELLLAEMNRKCGRCGTVPREPALCLLCGTLVCCKSQCCHVEGRGECSRHAAECGMGIGIFLLLRSTQMLILRGDRACMAPSIYLDVHGEEDAFLKRGRPLRLSRLRYDEIERMWLTAGLDQNSQLLHSSHLGSESL
ncbi:hypothetical protein KFL_003640090 [Klebsormidium nitens]|uniref:E3 ubiquitin-protein ligase n=1 Tax=Klebsormidium nitens TaxID=105231 RepID=A0A1Y1IFU1_KLENI|nr:hypothetical protein KFL_003640090 [Klebsormidium nitens]|eukprot:GAQ87607.1 hypothetical protein KFL_003640090 [Klebsormidium nitens]